MTTDDQRQQWERALAERADRYGANESAPGRAAARRLREQRLNRLLELGAGQGRDTLFFAREGFEVHALDYASSAVRAIAQTARQAGLAAKVTVSQHGRTRAAALR